MKASTISETFLITAFLRKYPAWKDYAGLQQSAVLWRQLLKNSMQVLFELLTCLFWVCVVLLATADTENALYYSAKLLIIKKKRLHLGLSLE